MNSAIYARLCVHFMFEHRHCNGFQFVSAVVGRTHDP